PAPHEQRVERLSPRACRRPLPERRDAPWARRFGSANSSQLSLDSSARSPGSSHNLKQGPTNPWGRTRLSLDIFSRCSWREGSCGESRRLRSETQRQRAFVPRKGDIEPGVALRVRSGGRAPPLSIEYYRMTAIGALFGFASAAPGAHSRGAHMGAILELERELASVTSPSPRV